jgi:hypothetical protein
MNQYDLVASPMRTAFVTGTPPKANFEPFNHVRNRVPLDLGVEPPKIGQASELELAWRKMKAEMFAGKMNKPDSVDVDTLSHLDWYEATDFKRPFPGETTVRWPASFKDRLSLPSPDLDD